MFLKINWKELRTQRKIMRSLSNQYLHIRELSRQLERALLVRPLFYLDISMQIFIGKHSSKLKYKVDETLYNQFLTTVKCKA